MIPTRPSNRTRLLLIAILGIVLVCFLAYRCERPWLFRDDMGQQEQVVLAGRSSTSRKPGGNNIYAELEMTIDFEYPMIFLTVLGYPRERARSHISAGIEDNEAGSSPLAKFVFLGNGTHDDLSLYSSPLVRKRAVLPNHIGWTIGYRINIPVPLWASDLDFTLSWRLEYSSHCDALMNHPARKCSFQGFPSGFLALSAHKSPMNDQQHDNSRPWLGRQDASRDWTYHRLNDDDDDVSASSCTKPWNVTRPYSLVVVGDSQPTYMCNHLAKSNTTSSRCVSLKGSFTNTSSGMKLNDFSIPYSTVLKDAEEEVVIFNMQGLWETAYGRLELFASKLDSVLDSITEITTPGNKNTKQLHFFLTTTAVHPFNYKRFRKDVNKWAMTQPRVHEVNALSKEVIRRRNAKTNSKVLLLDVEALSLLREDNPSGQGDMRHYGANTNELLLTHVLCEVDRHFDNPAQ
jgi:hypothetical protein